MPAEWSEDCLGLSASGWTGQDDHGRRGGVDLLPQVGGVLAIHRDDCIRLAGAGPVLNGNIAPLPRATPRGP